MGSGLLLLGIGDPDVQLVKLWQNGCSDFLATILSLFLAAKREYRIPRTLQQVGITPELDSAIPAHTDLDFLISADFRKRTTRNWILGCNVCSRWEEHIAWEPWEHTH